jgi:FAD/FMN-containing dehydrogenase
MMIGSEGSLGVITEAWMRLQGRPRFRADAVFGFSDFFAAARAVRAVSQAGSCWCARISARNDDPRSCSAAAEGKASAGTSRELAD